MATGADITLQWNGEAFGADVLLAGADLQRGDDLATATIVSLFTWRRAAADDPLPDGQQRMGWWGDTYAPVNGDRIGSKLWLLRREKLTVQTINRAVDYVREALQWMIEDKVAQRIEVAASRGGLDQLDLLVTIYQRDGAATALRFSGAWQAIQRG